MLTSYFSVFDFVNVHLFHDESNIALIHEVSYYLIILLISFVSSNNPLPSKTPTRQWENSKFTGISCKFFSFLLHHGRENFLTAAKWSTSTKLTLCKFFCVKYFFFQNPALYSENRKRALNFVLNEMKRVSEDEGRVHPLFIFGDLNFRLDLQSFLNVRLNFYFVAPIFLLRLLKFLTKLSSQYFKYSTNFW